MNELSGLISRKKELLKLREVVKRKQNTEMKDSSDKDSDVVEDSDADIPPIISSSSLRQMRLPITNEVSNKNKKISIITEDIIRPTKKQVPDNASHSATYSECVTESGSQSIKAGLAQAPHNFTDLDIVDDSDTEIPPILFNSSIRSQRNVTVYSTDDEPSNESINTSSIHLPPVGLGNNVSAIGNNTNNASSTFSDNELNSDGRQYISVVNVPLELRIHNSTMNECTTNGVTNNVTNNSATSLPENRQMCLSITNEESNKDKKINIISEVIIRPAKKLVTGNASHSAANIECVIERGLQPTEAGSNQVTSTENYISEAKMDAPSNFTDLESTIETKLEPFKASSVNSLMEITNSNDHEIPSLTEELHTQYELASCSSRQENSLFEGYYSDQETPAVVNTFVISSQIDSGRKKRSVTQFQKAYMDFKLEEDIGDFSSGSSDNWSPKETENDSSSETKKKAKKRTRHINNDETNHVPVKKMKIINKIKTRKLAKEKGLSYETITGKVKESRKLKNNPCVESKCPRKCFDIPEERRQALFDFFWGLDDQRKKEWIVQCAAHISIKRKRTDSPVSRRDKTFEYYINEGEGRRQVCQQFLRSTLDISQTYLLYNLSNAKEGISQADKRTRHAVNKYDENTHNLAKKYIEDLPVLPSHYSRLQSSRLYISQDFKNVTNLYRLYVKHCVDQASPYLSDRLFRNVFNEYNLSFHIPKKDKCKLCVKFDNNTNVLNEKETNDYQNHLDEKKACYKRSEIHRNMLCNDNSTVMASFDLQKVLNTPHGQSMLLYYSRKYAVYNLTVYESYTQNGFCYTWGESDGKRGSCEIGTCLYKYLLEVDKKGTKYVILYCDSCWGQNKNKVILSVFKYFLENAKNVLSVQVNYLLPGHTYMPVDSMHSVIEREVRKLIVWSPVQWPTFMLTARKTPRPYIVNTLDHTDFINWEIIANQIFTPKTTSDQHFRLKDIRIATIKKTNLNELQVKYTMKDDGDTFKIILGQGPKKIIGKGKGKGKGQSNARVVTNNPSNDSLQKLYVQRLPISTKKYMDLKKLCDDEVIPKQYVQDYLQLPYVDKTDYLDDIIQDEVPTNDGETQDQSEEVDESNENKTVNKKEAIQKARNQTNKEKKKGKAEGVVKATGTVKKGKGKAKQGKTLKKNSK